MGSDEHVCGPAREYLRSARCRIARRLPGGTSSPFSAPRTAFSNWYDAAHEGRWLIQLTHTHVGGANDGKYFKQFAARVNKFTKAHPTSQFNGSLSFLNSYKYIMGEAFLTGLGAGTEFESGVNFWNNYGRTLYNATLGQVSYDPNDNNGTARRKPVLRSEFCLA
jgi:hypothetical protein